MTKTRGRIIAIARALSPIRHGGDTVGNVHQIRRKTVYTDDGPWDVPFISGNSIKHLVRENAARFAMEASGLTEGLTRAEVQLLISGGALTKSGASVRLDAARRAEEVFPVLGLCGYGAGNVLTESQVRVDHWELVCAENAGRLRSVVEEYADDRVDLLEQYASEFIRTKFGARNEPSRRRGNREMMSDEEREAVEKEVSEKMTTKGADKGDSLQMFFEFETLVEGSVFVGGFSFPHGISDRELAAFRSAFTWASEGVADDGGLVIRIGGRSSVGYGKVSLHLHGLLAEGIEPMRYEDTDELVPPRDAGDGYDDAMQDYIAYLADKADDAREAFGGLL